MKNEDCENQVIGTVGKKEEILVTLQAVQSCSDTKAPTETKNTQVRVVRGTKKMKLDVSDSNNYEKKGLFRFHSYIYI